MEPTASPPPEAEISIYDHGMEDQLDDDIARVRAEIQKLTSRRKLLASSLLSSSKIQDQLHRSNELPHDLNVLAESQEKTSEENAHRLAFGITAFPFRDPSPETSDRPLLGVRFDVPHRGGTFENCYYLLLKRIGNDGNNLKIHRHTMPALVPLSKYEEKYLGVVDEGYGSEDSILGIDGNGQDLHGLVKQVRRDLVSWRLRISAIEVLREQLGLESPSTEQEPKEGSGVEMEGLQEGKYGITGLAAATVDATQIRVVWSDGRVGRMKITDRGTVERVVVYGGEQDQGKPQRLREHERFLQKESPSIDGFELRLRDLQQRFP